MQGKKKAKDHPERDAQSERRSSSRKEVLETFQVFLVAPKLGHRKLHLRDVSESGLSFFTDPADPINQGDSLECFFYINPGLRLPLALRIARIDSATGDEQGSLVGAEFAAKDSKGYKAYSSFLTLLDDLSAFVEE